MNGKIAKGAAAFETTLAAAPSSSPFIMRRKERFHAVEESTPTISQSAGMSISLALSCTAGLLP